MMLFGLTNAPTTFMELINMTFQDYLDLSRIFTRKVTLYD